MNLVTRMDDDGDRQISEQCCLIGRLFLVWLCSFWFVVRRRQIFRPDRNRRVTLCCGLLLFNLFYWFCDWCIAVLTRISQSLLAQTISNFSKCVALGCGQSAFRTLFFALELLCLIRFHFFACGCIE